MSVVAGAVALSAEPPGQCGPCRLPCPRQVWGKQQEDAEGGAESTSLAVDRLSHRPCHSLKYVSITLSQSKVCLNNLVTV